MIRAFLTLIDCHGDARCARVTATEVHTGAMARTVLLPLFGQATVDLLLAPGEYRVDVRSFSDLAASALLCSTGVPLDLRAGPPDALVLELPGGEPVDGPTIHGVDCHFGHSSVRIVVDASDSPIGDGELTFAWSGAGLPRPMLAGNTAELAIGTLAASPTRRIWIIVQSTDGAAAVTSVTFETKAAADGQPVLTGATCVTVSGGVCGVKRRNIEGRHQLALRLAGDCARSDVS
jgi:hypothetical protein